MQRVETLQILYSFEVFISWWGEPANGSWPKQVIRLNTAFFFKGENKTGA